MRVTISHNKPKAQVIAIIDRTLDDTFRTLTSGPVEITDAQKSWTGSVMNFSFTAKAGFLKNQIQGTAEVTDTDLIIDADLGIFGKFISQQNAQTAIESRVRGLLA